MTPTLGANPFAFSLPTQGGGQARCVLRRLLTAIMVFALSTAGANAWAAPGDLDPTFSGDGKVTTPFFTGANSRAAVYALAL